MIPSKKSISKKQLSLIIADLIVLSIVPFLSAYLYLFVKLGFNFQLRGLSFNKILFFINILIFISVFYILDLYNFKKDFINKREVVTIFLAVCAGWLISIFLFYLVGLRPLGRGISLVYIFSLFLLMTCCRIIYTKLAVSGIYNKKAIIVGAGKGGQAVASLIKENPQVNIDVLCFIDIDKEKEGTFICEKSVVCQEGSLSESVSLHNPDLLILAMRSSRYEKLLKELIQCSQKGIEIQDMTSIFEELAGKIPLKYVSDRWVFFSHLNQPRFYFKRIKRLIDIFISSVILIITSPIMVISAFAIKIDSSGPVFFRQLRVGKDGTNFELIKFRSMIDRAEEESGAVWAGEKDPRITRAGKIIRLLRIDELPQLYNVFINDMSLIGPRPERPEFVSNFLGQTDEKNGIIPFYSERLSIKPGITGWAQVMYPYASSFEQTVEKLEYDLYYLKNMSFHLDIAILLKTIRVVLFGKGAK